MSFISEKIVQEYSKIDPDAPVTHIERVLVDEAMAILRNFKLFNACDFFLYLSAINLLNAAIKQADYKHELSYGFIKRKAVLATKIIITRFRRNDIRYHYSDDEKCLYIEIYDVVFSFHNIIEESFIIEKAAKTNKIEWPEIRLQRIASTLFELAKSLCSY